MTTLRENLIIRPYRLEEVQALSDIYNAAYAADGSPFHVSAEEIVMYTQVPKFNLELDSFVVERDGKPVALADIEFSDQTGRAWASGAVHPEHRGQGIGTKLIELTEKRALGWAATALPADHPLQIQRYCSHNNAAAARLFEAHGYYLVRSYYRMGRELDTPIEAPPLPAGLTLRPFDEARDAHAVYEAHEESFQDHWGYERDSFEEWTHYLLKAPDTDPTLWLIAVDGDEIAGICLNSPYGESDPEQAYTNVLGVRRNWRKLGLGSALLQQSFALFQARGFKRAALGVDAYSLTNAVALYERAGMHVQERTLAYRKMLRGEDTEILAQKPAASA
jgi:mycothiol synthase